MLVVVPTPLSVSYQRSQQAEGWWSIHEVYPNAFLVVLGVLPGSRLYIEVPLCFVVCCVFQFVVFLTVQCDTLVVGTQTFDCSLWGTMLLVHH